MMSRRNRAPVHKNREGARQGSAPSIQVRTEPNTVLAGVFSRAPLSKIPCLHEASCSVYLCNHNPVTLGARELLRL